MLVTTGDISEQKLKTGHDFIPYFSHCAHSLQSSKKMRNFKRFKAFKGYWPTRARPKLWSLYPRTYIRLYVCRSNQTLKQKHAITLQEKKFGRYMGPGGSII